MIGSALCYVLVPLVRFINAVSGEKRKKHERLNQAPCMELMNGQAPCDGCGDPLWTVVQEQGQQNVEGQEAGPPPHAPGSVEIGQQDARSREGEDGMVQMEEGRRVDADEHLTAGAEAVEPTVPEAAVPWSKEPQAAIDLRALLSQTSESESWWEELPSPYAGWHFPTGPGLGELMHCPAWQFPGLSYYPTPQPKVPFEVVWRVWEDLCEISAQPQLLHCESFQFTVMCYNILAQDLLEANAELYQHCSPEVLVWASRRHGILLEIQKWEPDILCLQEVQHDHFAEELQPAFSKLGYDCVYKQRTGNKTDGCATCYRRCTFSQVSVRQVEFRHPNLEMLDRDNVGLVLLLQPHGREDLPPVCVANTHLLFNPRRGDVKLAQLAILLAEIHSLLKTWQARGVRCPVLFCGDFNAVPNMPLYQFITTGKLYYHGMLAWMISGQEDMSQNMHHRRLSAPLWPNELGINDSCQYESSSEEANADDIRTEENFRYSHKFLHHLRFCAAACVRPPDLELIPGVTDATPDMLDSQLCIPRFRNIICHGLSLHSAYSHYTCGTCQDEVTTLHENFGATVDYIFYSSDAGSQQSKSSWHAGSLKLIGRLALLSQDRLWPLGGLPNKIFPSDHLSLLAKFELNGCIK